VVELVALGQRAHVGNLSILDDMKNKTEALPPSESEGASAAMATDDEVSTPETARAAVVRSTGRGYTSVRQVFVQKHSGPVRESTLARFCRNRKRRALVLYLLLLTLWDPERDPFRSEVWLRILDVAGGKHTWSKSSLSSAWTTLIDMGLATRKRTRRMADVVPLREDGVTEYEPPDGNSVINRYFALPGAFWTEKWFDELSLPGICVLLVLLKETNDEESEIHLTYQQFDDWYGISASSAQKGLNELADAGLVSVRRQKVKADFATEGFTMHLHFELNGAFSTIARKEARAEAAKAARARAAKAGGKASHKGVPRAKKTSKSRATKKAGARAVKASARDSSKKKATAKGASSKADETKRS
jgi:hypothetical protein